MATFSTASHPDFGESSRHAAVGPSTERPAATRDRDLSPDRTAAGAGQYCFLLVLLPLLAIPLGIALGRSDFFLRHGASVWVRSDDAVFDMHGRNCEVVLFGDSTAMTGIDPDLVEQQTGLRTCNIAVTNAVLAVTDNMTLDHYLAHNARPRIVLVQLSPEGFQQANHAWRSTIYAEGLLELLRHGTPEQSREVLLSHPQESIAFAGYAAGFTAYYGIRQAWFRLTGMRPEEDTLTVRNGFFTPPSPPRTHCDPVASTSDPTGGAFARSMVEAYRQQYSTRSDAVLVNVAPIPSCDGNLQSFRSQLNGITSNNLLPLPIDLFNDERHFTARGSTIVSRLIAAEVKEAETAIPQRAPGAGAIASSRPTTRRP